MKLTALESDGKTVLNPKVQAKPFCRIYLSHEKLRRITKIILHGGEEQPMTRSAPEARQF